MAFAVVPEIEMCVRKYRIAGHEEPELLGFSEAALRLGMHPDLYKHFINGMSEGTIPWAGGIESVLRKEYSSRN